MILRTHSAVPVSVKASHWLGTAALQLAPQDIFLCEQTVLGHRQKLCINRGFHASTRLHLLCRAHDGALIVALSRLKSSFGGCKALYTSLCVVAEIPSRKHLTDQTTS